MPESETTMAFNNAAIDVYRKDNEVVAVIIWRPPELRPFLCFRCTQGGRILTPFALVFNDDIPPFDRRESRTGLIVEIRRQGGITHSLSFKTEQGKVPFLTLGRSESACCDRSPALRMR
ncbi:MAG: hypothetical protein BroJett021_33510 [Chloroflexota bacterium]|jgi:hypothetical protein|nr:MAG: hypothetical protein BroJett021_33510 [Chloroflexota bacterium]